jgi:hypothetical protein
MTRQFFLTAAAYLFFVLLGVGAVFVAYAAHASS